MGDLWLGIRSWNYLVELGVGSVCFRAGVSSEGEEWSLATVDEA